MLIYTKLYIRRSQETLNLHFKGKFPLELIKEFCVKANQSIEKILIILYRLVFAVLISPLTKSRIHSEVRISHSHNQIAVMIDRSSFIKLCYFFNSGVICLFLERSMDRIHDYFSHLCFYSSRISRYFSLVWLSQFSLTLRRAEYLYFAI